MRLIIAVALVAIGAGTAYYFYVTKKPKAKFTFALPTPTSVLGLPIGQHISCRGRDDLGEEVIKPYTPATLDSDIGYFELVIKVVYAFWSSLSILPRNNLLSFDFYADTMILVFLSNRCIRKEECPTTSMSCRKGRFKYQPGQVEAFGTLAGDTGIAPMFQVARAILENPNDKTNVYLIYANVTFYDILLKLQPPQEWDGGVGFISKEMILTHCPAPASDIQILWCGPPPTNKAMAAHLKDLGYTPEMQFQFGAFDELPPILDVTLFTASISSTHILSM
ncbi:NADH-cytochrome b5 reductase [Citrus sinensis]|uniref:NADH-cytochrome b5 reductase n=1 Tax=Citrus sinensis TaxID=2711 RepID=A0ACB8N070_CITSI|nr:NADH-cytochrome b5 reductase [Citrus sinensis]